MRSEYLGFKVNRKCKEHCVAFAEHVGHYCACVGVLEAYCACEVSKCKKLNCVAFAEHVGHYCACVGVLKV